MDKNRIAYWLAFAGGGVFFVLNLATKGQVPGGFQGAYFSMKKNRPVQFYSWSNLFLCFLICGCSATESDTDAVENYTQISDELGLTKKRGLMMSKNKFLPVLMLLLLIFLFSGCELSGHCKDNYQNLDGFQKIWCVFSSWPLPVRIFVIFMGFSMIKFLITGGRSVSNQELQDDDPK